MITLAEMERERIVASSRVNPGSGMGLQLSLYTAPSLLVQSDTHWW